MFAENPKLNKGVCVLAENAKNKQKQTKKKDKTSAAHETNHTAECTTWFSGTLQARLAWGNAASTVPRGTVLLDPKTL